MAFQSLSEINLSALTGGRTFNPSPAHWEDQVIYFLLADRFSDDNASTPLFQPADNGNAIQTETDAAAWRDAGTRFVGGTLKGIQSRLDYLKGLGVTVVWISPILKQVPVDETYHGYGIQDFLQVEPRFGTPDDLRNLVKAAHDRGMFIILDIILNHSGDVFRYQADNPRWNGQQFDVAGFRDAAGNPTLPLSSAPGAFPDGAIWPSEFQSSDAFTREGAISNFDFFPEYADGDFFSLKDLHHGDRVMLDGLDQIDQYRTSATLENLCAVYKYWIAFADLDGYRLDTVKHMDGGATRYFASVIHEFTEAIGKDNFYIIGEITGGRDFAFERLQETGLDAALGISDERSKMIDAVKGNAGPEPYFDLFRNSLCVHQDSHTWFRDKIVTSIDDHDHVDQGQNKHRFCAGGYTQLCLAAMAMNATTLGIPCIYYGTEQLFDGQGNGDGSDRYIREAMFGGAFGAFRSKNVQFFDPSQLTYNEIAKIHAVRAQHLPLRRGRQYLRPISGDGTNFGIPDVLGGRMKSIVAWSRIHNDIELLCAINTDPGNATTAFVTIDNDLHATGSRLTCIYSTTGSEIGRQIAVEARNGKSTSLTVPTAGFVIYG